MKCRHLHSEDVGVNFIWKQVEQKWDTEGVIFCPYRPMTMETLKNQDLFTNVHLAIPDYCKFYLEQTLAEDEANQVWEIKNEKR